MENQRLKELAGLVLTEKMWSGGVKTKWKPPEGFFTQSAEKIVKGLLASPDGTKKAMSRLNFYINRGGKNITGEQKAELERAKELLSKKLDKLKEEKEAIARRAGVVLIEKKKHKEENEDPDMDMGDEGGGSETQDEEALPKIVSKIAKKAVGKGEDELEELILKVYEAGHKDGMQAAKDDESKKDKVKESVDLTEKHHVKKDGKVTKKGTKDECEAHAKVHGGDVCVGDGENMAEEFEDYSEGLAEDWTEIQHSMAKVRTNRIGKPCMTPKGSATIELETATLPKGHADPKAGPYEHTVTVKLNGSAGKATFPASQIKLFKGKKPDGKMLPSHSGSTAFAHADKSVGAKAAQANQPGKKPSTNMFKA